jgi:hypothetical protein
MKKHTIFKNFISSNQIFIYIKNNTNNIRSFIVFIQLKFNLINKEDIFFSSMNMKIKMTLFLSYWIRYLKDNIDSNYMHISN